MILFSLLVFIIYNIFYLVMINNLRILFVRVFCMLGVTLLLSCTANSENSATTSSSNAVVPASGGGSVLPAVDQGAAGFANAEYFALSETDFKNSGYSYSKNTRPSGAISGLSAIKAAEAYAEMVKQLPESSNFDINRIGERSTIVFLGTGVNKYSSIRSYNSDYNRNYGYNNHLTERLVPTTPGTYSALVLKSEVSENAVQDRVFYTEGVLGNQVGDKRAPIFTTTRSSATDRKVITECTTGVNGCPEPSLYLYKGTPTSGTTIGANSSPWHGVIYGSQDDTGYGLALAGVATGRWDGVDGHGVANSTDVVSVKNIYTESSLAFPGSTATLTVAGKSFSFDSNTRSKMSRFNFDPVGGPLYYSLKYSLDGINNRNLSSKKVSSVVFNHDLVYYDFTQGFTATVDGKVKYFAANARIAAQYSVGGYRTYGLLNATASGVASGVGTAQLVEGTNANDKAANYYSKIQTLLRSSDTNDAILLLSASSIAHVNMAQDAKSSTNSRVLLVAAARLNSAGTDYNLYLENGVSRNALTMTNSTAVPYYNRFYGCSSFGVSVPTVTINGSTYTGCITAPAEAYVTLSEDNETGTVSKVKVAESGTYYQLKSGTEGTVSARYASTRTGITNATDSIFGSHGLTGVAASYVAGAIATIESYFGATITPREIVAKLLATANKSFPSYTVAKYGAGFLDLEAAIKSVGVTKAATQSATNIKDLVNKSNFIAVKDTNYRGTVSSINSFSRIAGFLDRAVAFDSFGFPYASNLGLRIKNSEKFLKNNLFSRRFVHNSFSNYNRELLNVGIHKNFGPLAFAVDIYSYGSKDSFENYSHKLANKILYAADSIENNSNTFFSGGYFSYKLNNKLQLSMGVNKNFEIDSDNYFANKFKGLDLYSINLSASSPYAALFAESSSSNFYKANYKINEKVNMSLAFISGKSSYDLDSFKKISPNLGFSSDNNIAVAYNFNYKKEKLNLSLYMGAYLEKDSFLGSYTTGALKLGETTATSYLGIGAGYNITPNLYIYAKYHQAYTNISNSNNYLFKDISLLNSSALSVGLLKSSNNAKYGLVYSEPLRINNGEATASIVVGRTQLGNFIRESQSFSLKPTGKERDIEAFYNIDLKGDRGTLSFNISYKSQPFHYKELDSEKRVAIKWIKKF